MRIFIKSIKTSHQKLIMIVSALHVLCVKIGNTHDLQDNLSHNQSIRETQIYVVWQDCLHPQEIHAVHYY